MFSLTEVPGSKPSDVRTQPEMTTETWKGNRTIAKIRGGDAGVEEQRRGEHQGTSDLPREMRKGAL